MAANRKTEVDAAIADVDFSTNDYQIEFDTDAGKIILDLWPDVAPGHCRNIIGLTKIGYYDGIIFHRVISGFVIQAGCPEGRGTGGPGYKIDQEFNDRLHEAGVLSMARTNDPNSAGSQFCSNGSCHHYTIDRVGTVQTRGRGTATVASV